MSRVAQHSRDIDFGQGLPFYMPHIRGYIPMGCQLDSADAVTADLTEKIESIDGWRPKPVAQAPPDRQAVG